MQARYADAPTIVGQVMTTDPALRDPQFGSSSSASSGIGHAALMGVGLLALAALGFGLRIVETRIASRYTRGHAVMTT